MIKKIIIAVLSAILLLGLVACGGEETTYTMTYIGMDGKEVGHVTVSNEKISLADGPEIEGYRFEGWYLDKEDQTTKLDDDYFINNPATDNMIAYAVYTKLRPSYVLTLEGANGATVLTLDVSDQEITLPDAPAWPGYRFTGWQLGDGDDVAVLYQPGVYRPCKKYSCQQA